MVVSMTAVLRSNSKPHIPKAPTPKPLKTYGDTSKKPSSLEAAQTLQSYEPHRRSEQSNMKPEPLFLTQRRLNKALKASNLGEFGETT